MKTIGVAILTWNAEKQLPKCLKPLLASSLQPRILVVDSSSRDNTVLIAREMGAEVRVIPQRSFNHGATREMARKILNTDIVVMMTPDAFAVDSHMLQHLVKPILQNEASITYARQIEHEGADVFEAFPREFNYPAQSQVRSLSDINTYGVYTFFCSDSCAAYSNKALNEIGGIPSVLFGEDTLVTARLLKAGHKIAYVAEAVVRHSHRYTLKQEFKRHFDIGLSRKEHAEIFKLCGSASKRGALYTKSLFTKLWKQQPHLLPYAFLQTLVKWFGYKLGKSSVNSPRWWKRKCSSHPTFFLL